MGSRVSYLALAAALLLSSCASAPQSIPAAAYVARLEAGSVRSAPAGLLAWCERQSDGCGQVADSPSGGPPQAIEASWKATGGATSGAQWASAPSENAQERLFHELMEANARQGEIASSQQRADVTVTPVLWDQLIGVNRAVNRAIAPISDEAQYGVEEYWTRPTSGRGDCEDYALEKRARLLAMGWPAESLAFAVADAPDFGVHAVLIVQTDRGDLVLDNLVDDVRSVADLPYHWLSRQEGPSLTHWASAELRAAPGALETASSDDATGLFHQMMNAAIERGAADQGASQQAGDVDRGVDPHDAIVLLEPIAFDATAPANIVEIAPSPLSEETTLRYSKAELEAAEAPIWTSKAKPPTDWRSRCKAALTEAKAQLSAGAALRL